MSAPPRRRLAARLLPVLGLLSLHALVSWPFPWEETTPLAALARPNADLLLLLSVAFALALRFGDRALLSHGLSVAVLFVPLYRFGATVMPVFYGKELDPYNDLLMAPGLVHLLLHRYPPWMQVLLSVVTVAAALSLYLGFQRLVRSVVRAGGKRTFCLAFLGAAQVLVAATWIHASAVPGARTGPFAAAVLPPALADGADAIHQWWVSGAYQEELVAAEARLADLPASVGGLHGADVYVFFVESYGMSLFRKPDTAEVFRGWTPAWEQALLADGFQVLSATCHPSISGGSSALSHAQFLAGVTVENRRQFDALLASSLTPLPERFTRSGYLTLNVQPATDAEWPEGKFFGFEEDLFLSSFPYEGPSYHWGTMPDQYALVRLFETVVREADRPLFVQYISVTSHAPFSMIPPYLEDWDAAAQPGSFDREPARVYPIDWLNYAGHPEVEAAYMDTVRYSLDCFVGFTRQLTRPSLVLVIGDHQAPRVGDLRNFDGTFDVPVHAISNREELLLPFLVTGFREGFVPDVDFPSYSTTEFLPFFLTLFGG